MYLFVLVLNKTELLEDILGKLVQIGISGATIIDSTGMGRALSDIEDDTLLVGIRSIFKYSRPSNKTIFSVIDSLDKKERATAAIKEVVGDISKPGVGIMFTLPLEDVIGFNNS
jgi:nitrogen regulatory protein P-II 1